MPKNRLNIQRSEFLSFLERVDDHQGLEDLIRLYKKKYNTARHVCWGAVIEEKGTYLEQSSDGQEPRGTAGPQILAQIKSNHLHNVVVIVVRYFGDKKLGKKLLSEAYKTSAEIAIKTCL